MQHIGPNSQIPSSRCHFTAPSTFQMGVKLAPKPKPTSQTASAGPSPSFIKNCLGALRSDQLIKFFSDKKPGDYIIRESNTNKGELTLSYLRKPGNVPGDITNKRNLTSIEDAEAFIKNAGLTPRMIPAEEYMAFLVEEHPVLQSFKLSSREKESIAEAILPIRNGGSLRFTAGDLDFMVSFQSGRFLVKDLVKEKKKQESILRDNPAAINILNTKFKMASYEPEVRGMINLMKAIRDEDRSLSVLSKIDLFAVNDSLRPLDYSFTDHEDQGYRKEMEDEHFILNLPNNEKLIGVFDGHGGSLMAEFAKKYFVEHFSEELSKNPNNIEEVFQTLLDKITVEARAKKIGSGCTVCVTYITNENVAYSLTLGDSEAKVFRKIEDKWRAIPLSLVMDWGKKKEEKRAPERVRSEWKSNPDYKDPKARRSPYLGWGANTSRSLGDFMYIDDMDAGFIHKGKVTRFQLEEGDVLISGCDGLWDFVTNEELSQILSDKEGNVTAEYLTNYALNKKSPSTDNITIIVANAK